MIKNYEYLLFKRFFFSRKNEGYISIISWFSLIGISLGVAVLIIVMSVMNGFRDELVSRIIGINGHINIFSSNNIITDEEISLFENNLDLNTFSLNPIIITQGLIMSDEDSRGIYIKSMETEDLFKNKEFYHNIKYGNTYSNNSDEILIGSKLSILLGVNINDKVKIVIPKTDKTIFGNIPRFKTLTVVGIFDLGMYEYDSSFVFVPYEIGRSLLLLNKNEFNKLEIFIKNPDYVDEHVSFFNNIISSNNLFHLFINSWKDNNRSFLEALKVERNVMFLILILIILIAALNIVSGLVIFVKDKNKDIGILKTIGTSKFSLLKIFLLIGSTIGFIGTLLGFFVGIIFCKNIHLIQSILEKIFDISLFSPEIYFLSSLPARINYYEVLFICFISLLISVSASIYPAIKSSKTNPIEIIRNE